MDLKRWLIILLKIIGVFILLQFPVLLVVMVVIWAIGKFKFYENYRMGEHDVAEQEVHRMQSLDGYN